MATAADQELDLADAMANPTVHFGGKAGAVFNGVTWDRQRGSVASTHVGNHTAVLSVIPVLDTSIYASGDSLHTAVLSFTSAVAVSGGSGTIKKLLVIDSDLQSVAGELWLFSATVTPAAANAAHSITDGHAALCVGVIPFGTYYASALNSVSVASPNLPFTCAVTTLFAIAVTRGTPTYTASGLTIQLIVSQD